MCCFFFLVSFIDIVLVGVSWWNIFMLIWSCFIPRCVFISLGLRPSFHQEVSCLGHIAFRMGDVHTHIYINLVCLHMILFSHIHVKWQVDKLVLFFLFFVSLKRNTEFSFSILFTFFYRINNKAWIQESLLLFFFPQSNIGS